MLSLDSLVLDEPKVIKEISDFIRYQVEVSGLKGAIVNVSGGIDSAVVLALSVRALKPRNVRALTLPERDITPESDITDVMQLTDRLNVTCDTVEITTILQVMRQTLHLYDPFDRIACGNIKARTRMIIAYHYANTMKRMVIGSSNKTEWLTGYFTKYGDGAVDLMPIADLYKNQVRQLARYLEIPINIIKKTPTAGLWLGQSDEEELGVSYDVLDLILYGDERGLSEKEIASNLKIDPLLVHKILERVRSNEHKRRLPLILRLSSIIG
jgi:NAD+ synthase